MFDCLQECFRNGRIDIEMEEHVFICEDSIDGILTGVYVAYQFKKEEGIESHDSLHLAIGEPDTIRLFTQYHCVYTDREKSKKVIRTLKRELGESVYYDLCLAMVCADEEKADAVYHTIVVGLKYHDKNVFERLHNDAVHKAFACGRRTKNELHYSKEFLRFEELKNGILYAKIGPRNHVLPFLVPQFADRLPGENFIIYDENRGEFALHPKFRQWYMVTKKDFEEDKLIFSEEEQIYKALFTEFCSTIAIEERVNLKLQQQMAPLRYRPYMVEFANKQ